MKSKKMWFYSVYVNGKCVWRSTDDSDECKAIAESLAKRWNGKVTKGFKVVR